MANVTSEEAKKLDQIEKKLIKEFKEQIRFDEKEQEFIQKINKPVTSAIQNVEGKIENVLNQNQNLMDLVPVVRQFADISIPESEQSFELPKLPSSTPFIQRVIDESTIVDPISPGTSDIIIGTIGKKFLPRAKDDKFGLYWDRKKKSFMIGNLPVNFEQNDIIIDDKTYEGTQGLWRLLTDKTAPKDDLYTEDDLKNYTEILWKSDSIYRNNDPSTRKPKSSQGKKYLSLIKPIWENRIEGSGIRKYSNDKIEYRYIDDLTKLDGIINYIYAQEKAGNNNFLNEKKAIKDFISNKLDDLIEKPDGIKYLKRILPAISSPIMKEGSGLLNDFINNLPFELHVPGYQYLGPGTKLEKRLKRGDPGVNPLDRAAMEHDKFYARHRDVESRHVADQILQDKAIDRFLSKDASLGERFVALPTAGAMFLKRKLGMGIEENSKF